MGVPLNYLAVFVSAVIAMAVGYIWYGSLFGNAWMKEIGKSKKELEKGMGARLGGMFILSLLMAWTLAHALIFGVAYLGFGGVNGALAGAFFNWLGFVVPVTYGSTIMEKRSSKLWAIQAGYYAVSFALMSLVLVLWT